MAEVKLQGIADSWSLIDFIRAKGVPDLQHGCTNSNTGDKFDALFFPTKVKGPDGKERDLMVAFSQNLDIAHSMDAIFAKKRELKIVELQESHNLYLCKQGGERELGSQYDWLA